MKQMVITGSHLTPAMALIEQLPVGWQVRRLDNFAGPKFKRYDWLGSLLGLSALPGLVLRARKQLQMIRPRGVVVSFGGYSGVPVCLAAKSLGWPLLIHEQTFGAGLANRLIAGLADQIAISWRSGRKLFPAKKTVLIGNPVRREILAVRRRPNSSIYITGGNQGSLAINRCLAPILPQLLKRYTVYHQCGQQTLPPARRGYFPRAYFKTRELAKIYSRAALVIGRSGINTVTELAYLKIPAVLVPLPYTQKNEQLRNAQYLAGLGLAEILPQEQLSPDRLLAAINRVGKKPLRSGFPRQRVERAAIKLYQLAETLICEP